MERIRVLEVLLRNIYFILGYSAKKRFELLNWIRIDCDAGGEYKPPFFMGSMLRGVIGNALKQVVCINPAYRCDGCFAASECLYHRFYELENVSPPFRLGISLQPKTLHFSIYLFEAVVHSLPYVLSAVKKAFEELGVGKEQTRLRVEKITVGNEILYNGTSFAPLGQVAPSTLEIDSFCQDVLLDFDMPMRIKENNSIARSDVQLHTLINNIHGRYRQLKGLEPQKLGYRVHGEIVRSTMKFVETQRYSNRQRTRMNMGGLKGVLHIKGLDKQSYVYLKIGEIIGVGKQTAFGLGSYRLIPMKEVE